MANFISKMEKLEGVLMVAGMVSATLIIFLQIILRFVFNTALPWAEELARYLFIYFTWIGVSAAILTSQHIRVEMTQEKLPHLKKYLEAFSTLVCFGVAVFLLTNGCSLLLKLSQFKAVSPTLKIPMWIFYMAVPLAGLLMSIKYLYKFVAIDVREFRRGTAG
jgi:C4-dicarboxylate transporter DctQ subunit